MKKGLSEAQRKEIFMKVLLDKDLRKKFLEDPKHLTNVELSEDDKAAFGRMKAALPAFDHTLDTLSGVVLCGGGMGGGCGIA